MAHGAKAPRRPMIGRAEPGFEGDAAGEDGLSGLRGGFPVPASGLGGAAGYEVACVG